MANRDDWEEVLEKATAYPVMVTDASSPGGSRSGPVDETQRIVDSALRAVLGGRTRVNDPKGLKSALARSFVEERIGGRRIYRNVPRGSIADTVGEGEVSGFQGALIAHAREVVDHGLPLLEGVRSLNPTVGEDDVAARAAVVRSNVMRLRDEFGRRDEPRPVVIEELLGTLLGDGSSPGLDNVGGIVGALGDELGLRSVKHVNSIEDEHQLTNYRLLAEYVVGLRTAWETARPIFVPTLGQTTYVSAKLRHVELMMQTITESLGQVRTAMDSVFFGEAERKIQKVAPDILQGSRISIEELLDWADETVSPDNVSLIRDGGRIAIKSLVKTVQKLYSVIHEIAHAKSLAGGLGAPRVVTAWRDLLAQWNELTDELESLADINVFNEAKNGFVSIPGSYGNELNIQPWDPAAEEVRMHFDRSTGRWTHTIDLPKGHYEYKFALDPDFKKSYPGTFQNIKLDHGGGPLTIEFDTQTKKFTRIGGAP